jgi:hypothetical protein
MAILCVSDFVYYRQDAGAAAEPEVVGATAYGNGFPDSRPSPAPWYRWPTRVKRIRLHDPVSTKEVIATPFATLRLLGALKRCEIVAPDGPQKWGYHRFVAREPDRVHLGALQARHDPQKKIMAIYPLPNLRVDVAPQSNRRSRASRPVPRAARAGYIRKLPR